MPRFPMLAAGAMAAFLAMPAGAQLEGAAALERLALNRVRTPDTAAAMARRAPSPWTVINRKVKQGRLLEREKGIPLRYQLQDVAGDRAASHRAEYLSLYGMRDRHGKFVDGSYGMVSEDWAAQPQGGWRITQWIFLNELDGTTVDAVRNVYFKTQDRTTLTEERGLRLEATTLRGSPELQAAYERVVAHWVSYQKR